MSGLDDLLPFFRFCQLVGFFPFRMEFEESNNNRQLTHFSFSWSYPITWWFVVIALVNYITYLLLLSVLIKTPELLSLPPVVNVTVMTVIFLYFLLLLSARYWITIRFSTFRKAIEFMRLAEHNLANSFSRYEKNSIKLRTYIGIVGTLLWVCYTI